MPRAASRGSTRTSIITRVTITTTTTPPEVLSHRVASRVRSRFDWSWVVHRRVRRRHGIHRGDPAGVSAVAKLQDAADRRDGGDVDARQLRGCVRHGRHVPPVPDLDTVCVRRVALCVRGRHRARVDERAHQHAVQDSLLCSLTDPTRHPVDPLHRRLDSPREPANRHRQPSCCRDGSASNSRRSTSIRWPA